MSQLFSRANVIKVLSRKQVKPWLKPILYQLIFAELIAVPGGEYEFASRVPEQRREIKFII